MLFLTFIINKLNVKPIFAPIYSILLLLVITFTGCKKDSSAANYSNAAIIIGPDQRTTDCAGIYFLKFQTGPNTYSASATDVSNITPALNLIPSDTFPILLTNINWHYGGCSPDMIIIANYQRQ
jgi:hypothetical protein